MSFQFVGSNNSNLRDNILFISDDGTTLDSGGINDTIMVSFTDAVFGQNNRFVGNIKVNFFKEGRYKMYISDASLSLYSNGALTDEIIVYFQYSLNNIDLTLTANYDLLDNINYTYITNSNNSEIDNVITTIDGDVDIEVYLSRSSEDFQNNQSKFITVENLAISASSLNSLDFYHDLNYNNDNIIGNVDSNSDFFVYDSSDSNIQKISINVDSTGITPISNNFSLFSDISFVFSNPIVIDISVSDFVDNGPFGYFYVIEVSDNSPNYIPMTSQMYLGNTYRIKTFSSDISMSILDGFGNIFDNLYFYNYANYNLTLVTNDNSDNCVLSNSDDYFVLYLPFNYSHNTIKFIDNTYTLLSGRQLISNHRVYSRYHKPNFTFTEYKNNVISGDLNIGCSYLYYFIYSNWYISFLY